MWFLIELATRRVSTAGTRSGVLKQGERLHAANKDGGCASLQVKWTALNLHASKVKAPSFGYANDKSLSLVSFQTMENTQGRSGESTVTGSAEPVTPDIGARSGEK